MVWQDRVTGDDLMQESRIAKVAIQHRQKMAHVERFDSFTHHVDSPDLHSLGFHVGRRGSPAIRTGGRDLHSRRNYCNAPDL